MDSHTVQIDEAVNSYIFNRLRVILSLNKYAERIVGVLHDVVKDCERFNWESCEGESCIYQG